MRTIAFSLLSAGIFRGEQSLAGVLEAGVDAVRAGAYENLQEVHLCAFTAEEQQTLINLCKSKFQEELGQHFFERAFVFVRTAA